VPLVLAVAAAGFGKTTLLSQWADLDARPFAWVTLAEADNDPAHLVASIAHGDRRAPRPSAARIAARAGVAN
jgi:LuxR family maltose regulon positive regulatory protein